MISEQTRSVLLSKNKNIEFLANWKTGLQTNKIEGLISGLVDGIITIKSDDLILDEFIVEMVGTSKGQILKDSRRKPLSNVIGDMLRIACYNALKKPGMLAYVYYDSSGNLTYTIITFDKQVGEILREAGVYLAVDVNRPQVRKLLQINQEYALKQFDKVFEIKPYLDPDVDLQKYLIKDISTTNIYKQFFKLIHIILKKKTKNN